MVAWTCDNGEPGKLMVMLGIGVEKAEGAKDEDVTEGVVYEFNGDAIVGEGGGGEAAGVAGELWDQDRIRL